MPRSNGLLLSDTTEVSSHWVLSMRGSSRRPTKTAVSAETATGDIKSQFANKYGRQVYFKLVSRWCYLLYMLLRAPTTLACFAETFWAAPCKVLCRRGHELIVKAYCGLVEHPYHLHTLPNRLIRLSDTDTPREQPRES